MTENFGSRSILVIYLEFNTKLNRNFQLIIKINFGHINILIYYCTIIL